MKHFGQGLSGLRRFNLCMVGGVFSLLFAERQFGHVLVAEMWIQRGITICGIGLALGILLQFLQDRQRKNKE